MGKIIMISEAAQRLGVTRQTLCNWANNGFLKVRAVGKAYYVDEDTVAAMQDTAADIEHCTNELKKLKEEEYRKRSEFLDMIRDKESRRRYYALCVENSIKTLFFERIVDMLALYGSLTQREASILKDYIEDEQTDGLVRKYGLTRERLRQLKEKAIRKSADLDELKHKIDHIHDVETENAVLRTANKELRARLAEYEKAEKKAENPIAFEYKELCETFSEKLIDQDLTVRALNCLKAADLETIGDLVKCDKTKLLKFRNFGKKSLRELDEFIARKGLVWGMDVDKYYQLTAEELTDNRIKII